jgi:hypothetical protein
MLLCSVNAIICQTRRRRKKGRKEGRKEEEEEIKFVILAIRTAS